MPREETILPWEWTLRVQGPLQVRRYCKLHRRSALRLEETAVRIAVMGFRLVSEAISALGSPRPWRRCHLHRARVSP